MSDTDEGVAHHGAPILTKRDYAHCEAMVLWIGTVRAARKDSSWYGPSWLPGGVDIQKSRLFWRIRSGKKPLPEPPPTCFSCPWYELVESAGPHSCLEIWFTDETAWAKDMPGEVVICQCGGYKVIERKSEDEAIVQFGSIQYRIWRNIEAALLLTRWRADAEPALKSRIEEKERANRSRGWYIERLPHAQEAKPA